MASAFALAFLVSARSSSSFSKSSLILMSFLPTSSRIRLFSNKCEFQWVRKCGKIGRYPKKLPRPHSYSFLAPSVCLRIAPTRSSFCWSSKRVPKKR